MCMILHVRSRGKCKSDRKAVSAQQEGKFFQNDQTTESGNQYSNSARVLRCEEHAINKVQGSTQEFY